MRLTVIVPAYNEEATIEVVLRRVLEAAGDAEVLVVDDASTDGTAALVERMADDDTRLRLLRHERNQGKGGAVRTALAAATGDFVLIQDADLEYDPADYPALLRPVERGDADVVFSSRLLGAHSCARLWYHLGNKSLTWWFDLLFGMPLTDVLSCYKVFRRDLIDTSKLRASSFDIDVEIPARLVRQRVRVFEVPVYYAARGFGEGKKIRWWHGFLLAWRALRCRLGA